MSYKKNFLCAVLLTGLLGLLQSCHKPEKIRDAMPEQEKGKISQNAREEEPNVSPELAREERVNLENMKVTGNPEPAVTSPESAATVEAIVKGQIQVAGKAKIGLLYFLDQPAHRMAVLQWFTENNAKVLFESPRFGYIDAELDWKDLGTLINTSGRLGLDDMSFMKLEVEALEATQQKQGSKITKAPDETIGGNSSFTGPVHSAGYGAKVAEFRKKAAEDLGITIDDMAGQGTLVAIYDGGIDLSRTDVFQNRIKDFLIGDESLWNKAEVTKEDFLKNEGISALPQGLEDLNQNTSLRFVYLSESSVGIDVNGSGKPDDDIAIAVYLNQNEPEARLRPAKGLAFGDIAVDFARARTLNKPQIMNAYTGRYYDRTSDNPSPVAIGFKFRVQENVLEVAFVGLSAGGSGHGIANLHMVGGDFIDRASNVRYQGVAPKTEFLGMQTWKIDSSNYGATWLPLARTMIQAAEAGADVIDLDIYTPGSRLGNDLLSYLACRITKSTASVPVVAAHNFGPLPNSVQSLAQSPCVLGIGASHSKASLIHGLKRGGVINPELVNDDDVQTASYSGRGFGINGLFKPDIISPAYGYTAMGRTFARFSGTSGATPTTAGMIALLKQAAKAKNATLNFEQVKFLLQGASMPVKDATPRDGYGYANLLSTWELFKQNYDEATRRFKANPMRLAGHKFLQFEGKPAQRIIPLPLERQGVSGSIDSPVSMRFWVEYKGASAGTAIEWLKFYDRAIGTPTSTLVKDVPMHGEVQSDINLVIELPDEAWNSLAAGDHVAIVKGVREEFATGRNVDFILPITITKGQSVALDVKKIDPLYIEQYQIWSIATEPGETIFVYGHPSCEGIHVGGAVDGQNADSYMFMVDHEAIYPHAAYIINSYGPMTLSEHPLAITAKKSIVRLGVVRYRHMNCAGPVAGDVTVKRAGFKVTPGVVISNIQNGHFKIDTTLSLQPTALFLDDGELGRGTMWGFIKKDASLILRMTVDDDVQFSVPAGTKYVRAIPKDSRKFQGGIASVKQDGTVEAFSSTIDEQKYANTAGFSSINYQFGGRYLGPEISKPSAGNTAAFIFAHAEKGEKIPVVLEMALELPQGFTVDVLNKQPMNRWTLNESKNLQVQATAPTATPQFLADFSQGQGTDGLNAWSYNLYLSYAIEETMLGPNGNVAYLPLTLWTGEVLLPFSMQK